VLPLALGQECLRCAKWDGMVAVGCLALVVLPLIGLVLGGYLAGPPGARWGAGAGFAIALISCVASGYVLVKVARRR
jgi:hypothetical protein